MLRYISTLLIVLNLSACGFSEGMDETNAMVDHFHELTNKQDHQAIYNMGNAAFKDVVSYEKLDNLLKLRHDNLGKSLTKTRTGYKFFTGLSGKTITVAYTTEFQLGNATESFKFTVEDNQYYLLEYNFKVTEIIKKANETVTA